MTCVTDVFLTNKKAMKKRNIPPADLIQKYVKKLKIPKYIFLLSLLLTLTNEMALSSDLQNNNKTLSLCNETADKIECPYQKTIIANREILFSIPLKSVKSKNTIPVVLFFQGSGTPVEFTRSKTDRFQTYYELKTIETLLNNGFAVIAPRAPLNYAWDTNFFPWSLNYKGTADYAVMVEILNKISEGSFGPLDTNRIYAAGLSSGGYQSSRMAITFPEKIRAVAIQSASYATCAGVMCLIGPIPDNHPPTLFLHGRRDMIVPLFTMEIYAQALQRKNIPVSIWIDDELGHAWSPEAPEQILNWFETN